VSGIENKSLTRTKTDSPVLHPHDRAKFPLFQAQRPKIHVNPIDGCQCSNELGAQLNLTRDHKKKKTTPKVMSLPESLSMLQ